MLIAHKRRHIVFTAMHRRTGVLNGGYTLVTLPRIVTPYRDGVDGSRARVTYQELVTR
jgi:hypothetical protein